MTIALAQFNPTVGDFAGNAARILDLAGQAKQRGADLAVFTELCLCGYPPQDLLERPAFLDRNIDELKALAGKVPLPALVGYAGRVKNSAGKSAANKAALLCGGRVVFEQSKMLLPTYDVFDESRYFQPADKQVVYSFKDEKLGITICEDVWNDPNFWPTRLYERDPVVELSKQGTSVLLNISASPYTIDKRNLRFEMLRAIAIKQQRPVVYVNQVGGDDNLIFDGASMAITADGRVAAQALAFREDLVLFDTVTGQGEIHELPSTEIAYAYEALLTGTADYVRKCGFKKVLVGLSGGIDSAVVAAIAVGYCTLYGDMAGGLAVISDVPKLMVYELANWINRERELIPRSTIDKAPSAELRPDQKDEDSLPPYDVLDRILKAYIEDLRSPQEIADHYGFDVKMVRDIALMVDRNEYKRKQAAPGLKITSRAFGFGRPFPIAQKFIP